MIKKKIVVLAIVGLLGSLLPLLSPPNRASAGCGFLDVTCNPRDWESPGETIRQINPPMPRTRSEVYDSFTIKNQSNEAVYFAYGVYNPSTPNTSGLAVMNPAFWVSEGWWKVNPGESKIVYETKAKGQMIYIRIQARSGVKAPTRSEHTATFCVSDHGAYTSKERDGGRPEFYLTVNDNSNHGSSCEQIGGHSETFWQVKANTNFTINP